MLEIRADLVEIVTNPDYCTDEVHVKYFGVWLRVGRQTGNWHPDGKVWLASIGTDIHNYIDPGQYAHGQRDWGATRTESIINAYRYAKSKTMLFPQGWLQEVMLAIEAHYANENEGKHA